jgi:hypothetical protein
MQLGEELAYLCAENSKQSKFTPLGHQNVIVLAVRFTQKAQNYCIFIQLYGFASIKREFCKSLIYI